MFNSNERNSLYEVFDAYSLKDFNEFKQLVQSLHNNDIRVIILVLTSTIIISFFIIL